MPSLSYFQAIILALVQGATEFLPVSSSGHLVLLRRLFGWSDDGGLIFDTLLHAGSLAAILLYFWREWLAMLAGVFNPRRAPILCRRLPWLLVLATLPAVVAAPFLKPLLEDAAGGRSAFNVALSMLATAGWFWLCDRRGSVAARPLEQFGWRDACLVGCAQVVALLPGASRSGWTTGAGVLSGYARSDAVRFAFYLAVPAVCGALVLQVREICAAPSTVLPLGIIIAGFSVSFLSSLAAIHFCLRFFKVHTFLVFRLYLLVVGLVLLINGLWRI